MGRMTSGNRGRGAGIAPGTIAVDAAATGAVAQLRTGLKGPLTWSKLSGASGLAIGTTGTVSLASALGSGGSAAAVVRVANGNGDAIERAIALSATGTATPAATPPPNTTALPQAASVLARWSADAIPAQADNTALTGWTDSVGGIAATQATASAQPKYRTGGQGGKPFVLFSGAQCLDAGSATPVSALMQGSSNTTMVVCRNVQATSFGFLFTASASTGYNLFHNGSAAGFFGNMRVPYAGTALTTLCYVAGQPAGNLGRTFINGTCIQHSAVLRSAAGHSVGIGSSPANIAGLGARAEVYEVIVWNRALTAAEVIQAEKWVREKYASPLPWAGGPFRVFHGDSLTMGENSSAALASYPARVAAINGWPFGTWTNLGHTGVSMNTMRGQAIDGIDPMVPLLGATPMHLAAWEWFNQRGLTTAAATAETSAYFQARRAAGVAKLVLMTSTDASAAADNGTEQKRADYNAFFDANWATYADAYVPIHTDARIGAEGACPNTGPFTPYFHNDGIHMIDAGYDLLAQLIAPAMA